MVAQKNTKTILVAPLDWGLGHATRCIPIIRELQRQGCNVLIASSGAHAILLQQAFPNIQILPLKGYGISYGKGNLMLQLFRQLPRFFKTIRYEQQWLEQVITDWNIDGIISDNRYGLYSFKVPTVFMTHQLRVLTPGWLKWLEWPAQKSIYRFINKFGECWVPDIANSDNSLGGILSHPKRLPAIPVRYIGWLTRFLPMAAPVKKKYRLLISLSGPEPQRTLLEKMLLQQLSAVRQPVMLVRGLPGTAHLPAVHLPAVKMVNHLSGPAMQQVMGDSEIFLSRCGYSTLMDLQNVSCRCIFIPTPGQTEQEYLGNEIATAGKAIVKQQQHFDLLTALQEAASMQPFSSGNFQNEQLVPTISTWLKTLH